MGGSESTLGSVEGYEVARVLINSPAHHAGLIPYFDVVVAVDGMALDREHKTQFQQYITKNLRKEITLSVFNLRCRSVRDVVVTPNDNWGGVGVLGCSLNWDTADRMVENTWHLVDVVSGSPAAAADLVPGRDYLLGMQTPEDETITMFSDADDFQDRLARWKALRSTGTPNLPNTLLLLVFDSVNNAVKEECVDMGAHLSLGVDVANGYLHVVPPMPGSTQLPVVKKFFVPTASPTPAREATARPPAASAAAVPFTGGAGSLQFPVAPTPASGQQPAAAPVVAPHQQQPVAAHAEPIMDHKPQSVPALPAAPSLPPASFLPPAAPAAVAASAVVHSSAAAPAAAPTAAPPAATSAFLSGAAAFPSPFLSVPHPSGGPSIASSTGGPLPFPAPMPFPAFPAPPAQHQA